MSALNTGTEGRKDIPKPMRDAQVLDRLRFRMGLPNLILSTL